jgi:membrane associated rhomboid family serine protease
MFRVTPVVRNLIIINVVIFLLQQFLPSFSNCIQDIDGQEVNFSIGLTELLALWRMDLCPYHPYQFFTYMFAHGGFGHIFFNMLAFASFAPILETYWGEKKFLIYYIATGIGAGIIYAFANQYFGLDSGGSMLGASGALYGVLMAFGLLFPNLELTLLFPPIPIKAKYMVFVIGFITYLMDRSGSVAHLAHFGGAFVGFVIIKLIWRERGTGGGY